MYITLFDRSARARPANSNLCNEPQQGIADEREIDICSGNFTDCVCEFDCISGCSAID
jgi:hypothetical protein